MPPPHHHARLPSVRRGEFDWFATDGAGHVGHFATAGFGPIPAIVLERLEELRKLDERILQQVPVIGEASGHLPGRVDDWLEMARRGLFSYDWQHWDGPYRRAATPSRPITITDLPAALSDAVRIVAWPDVRFAELTDLRPEKWCTCE